MDENVCSICWDEIEDPSVQLACKHRFHYSCIAEWSRRNHQCPLCRQDFTTRLLGAAPVVHTDDEDGEGVGGSGTRSSTHGRAADGARPGLFLQESDIGSEHLLTAAALSSITVLRSLAILFPNFMERLFAPQIKLGRQLQVLWRRPDFIFPSIVAALILFS